MASVSRRPGPGRGEMDCSYLEDDAGYGLVTFAGVMLMIVAVLNTLYGIAAIDEAHFFVADARYVFGDLNTWGWFLRRARHPPVLRRVRDLARRVLGPLVRRRLRKRQHRSCRRSGSPPLRSSR